MAERFAVGAPVRVRATDPAWHTRAPRYVRGHVGVVVRAQEPCTLPDDLFARSGPPRRQVLYTVAFPAAELWGAGTHEVVVQCWEAYLEPVTAEPEAHADPAGAGTR